MGVVRREGDWRLEKQEEGLYEITYQQDSQAIAVTLDYSPGMMDDLAVLTVPVHDVNSYAEAERLFEEHAHGGQPAGIGLLGGSGDRASRPSSPIDADLTATDLGQDRGDSDGDDLEGSLPPGGLAVVLIFVGGLVLFQSGFSPGEPMFLIGAGMAGVGVAILAWAGIIFRTQGWAATRDFLVAVDDEETSGGSTSSNDEPERTPPTPESLKNDLIFGRADQYCEWCNDGPLDNPEVHHITPRNEGGPNDPDNLIVLCPTCHRKADNGGISRTKLRGKLKHILGQEA